MNIKIVGIICVVVGAIMVLYTGFNYVTSETIVDIGPVEINADKNHFVQWSPYLGTVILIVGFVITFFKR